MAFAAINTKSHIFSSAFHPNQNVLATAQVSGEVQLFSVSSSGAHKLTSVQLHDLAATKIKFFDSGSHAVTGSSDGTCIVIDTNLNKKWQSVACMDDNDEDVVPISSLHVVDENVFISGDESGAISVWDTRMKVTKADGPPMELCEHEDTITDMCLHSNGYELISVSADGCLGHFDMRGKGKLVAMSDPDEDEMLFVRIMRGGKKIIAGCDSGKVKIFSWGDLGDLKDFLVGHPPNVASCCTINDRMFFTGAGDSVVRLASISPNLMLGMVGMHEPEDEKNGEKGEDMILDDEDEDVGGIPIESLSLNSDKTILATTAHDEFVKFFNVGQIVQTAMANNTKAFQQADIEDGSSANNNENSASNEQQQAKLTTQKSNPKNAASQMKRDDFFSDL